MRLPEGVTSVQCSQCKAVFAVQVQPSALMPSEKGPPPKRSRKRKKSDTINVTVGPEGNMVQSETPKEPPRALSAYNVFMKSEVQRVKTENPQLPHREAFKMAAERWQASPMNPQNGGERFPQKFSAGASAAAAAATATEGGGGAPADAAEQSGAEPTVPAEATPDTSDPTPAATEASAAPPAVEPDAPSDVAAIAASAAVDD